MYNETWVFQMCFLKNTQLDSPKLMSVVPEAGTKGRDK